MQETIGFIGLGIMGQGMARNIMQAGYPLVVWNRTAAKTESLVAGGATAATSPADLAARCDIIITCVSDTPDVERVILGDDGVLHGVREGALVIDMSTISPQATQTMAEALRAKGVGMLDAPVSGGSEGAAKGTLSIMVGGSEGDFNRALPVLQTMGKAITLIGETGAGQTTKLMNQILVVGNALAMCEALLFAKAGGLDMQKALAAVEKGAAGSWMLSNRGPQILARDWRPGFMVDLQQKDLRLVMKAADDLETPLLLTPLVFNLYRTLQSQGLGEEGNHALMKALEALAGIEVSA